MAAVSLPPTYRRLLVTKLTNKFREAVKIETLESKTLLSTLGPSDVLIHNHYLGVNASDVNFSAGKYDPRHQPPFGAGMEAVGTVVAIGNKVGHLRVGSPVAVMAYGAYADYIVVPAAQAIPIPSAKKEFLGLLVTGLTSSIALEESGRMATREKVLVTAAAGGAGQIAVQLAKLAGNYVVGTCSSDEKVQALKNLGCDRVINYKKENFAEVLKKEFPKGIDVIYESVGGQFFDICMKNLAVRGRLIVIGSISNYTEESKTNQMAENFTGTVSTYSLLNGSRTVSGFFLNNYRDKFPEHFLKLVQSFEKGELKLFIDDKFRGLEGVADAVDYLHAGKNVGKVVVTLNTPTEARL